MTHNGSPKKVVFTLNDVEICEILNHGVIAKVFVDHSSNVYMFSHFMPFSNPYALLTDANEARNIWHGSFGHLNYKYLSYLCEKYMVSRLPKVKFSKGVCQGCILGKHPDHKYERVSHEKTFSPLEIIQSAIVGPFPHISMSQYMYVLTFINYFSRYY